MPFESTVMEGFIVETGNFPTCGGAGAQWPPGLHGGCEGLSHWPGELSSGQKVRVGWPGHVQLPSARVGVPVDFSPCTWMASVTKSTVASAVRLVVAVVVPHAHTQPAVASRRRTIGGALIETTRKNVELTGATARTMPVNRGM